MIQTTRTRKPRPWSWLAALSLLYVPLSYGADCAGKPAWNANDVYTGGDQVKHSNSLFEAKWWTQNQNPDTNSSEWAVWANKGACGDTPPDNQAPTAEANGPYTGGVSSAVQFSSAGTSDSDGTVTSYQWNFGDGNTSSDANPSHAYSSAGSYSVSLTVTDDDGATATDSATATITDGTPPGNCPAYVAGTAYNHGDVVSNAGGFYQCDVAGWCSSASAWAYEPGVGAHWQDAWHSVSGDLCDGEPPVNQPPVANANGPYNAKVTATVNFSSAGSNDPDGNISSYLWTFGDGSSSTQANPGHAYAAKGTYTVNLTVTDQEGASTTATTNATITDDDVPPPSTDKKIIGYFVEWGVYGRDYHVKDIDTSGSAQHLTHIVYAFGNVQNGECKIGDSYAAYDKFYAAGDSVDGEADTWDQGALRGNFNQLKKLKAKYPNLKVLWSFGGWTWSSGFGEAAQNPAAFANSCYDLVNDSRWAGVFDGIDIDWEYPNECGLTCDTSGFDGYKNLMQALRARFGSQLVTSAIGAGEAKLNAANYGGAAQYVDFYMLMTYDFFGAWDNTTAPHSPLYSYNGIPLAGFYTDNGVQVLKSKGVPDDKILLGIGFYGRGWTGVTQSEPGATATGPAQGEYEKGIDDYKVLKARCPSTGTIAGTAYAHCGNEWWGYDTPATIIDKMGYSNQQGLGGAFFWELSGDTANGELINAIANGLAN